MRDRNYLIENEIDVLKGIELLGDQETYDSIMIDFLNGYTERMNKIASYKDSGDMSNYQIEVHSLKSDSKYLGFMKLAEIAYRHEMASKERDISSINQTYSDLINEANRVVLVSQNYINHTANGSNTIYKDKEEVQMISSMEVEMATKAILVADDSSIIRNFVKEIFSSNYDVLMASNGQEVMNIVHADPSKIAALLLDLNMPGVNGFDVLEQFKEEDLFHTIPVSIISGINDKESIDKAFTYPIVDMLNKPFNKENVKIVVEKTIEYGNIER